MSQDQYEILETLGSGSYGKVEKIRRKIDDKILVWKEINFGNMSEKEKTQLVSEVNILRELRNPFIVRYHDRIVDKPNTKLYIIMECCKGGDLSQIIKKCRREMTNLDEGLIWRILAQCVLALKECHCRKENAESKPILHRDLKPANILLDDNKNIKMGDFGLAKELSSRSKMAQTNVGTPFYMAPEIMNEHDYDEKSDIWSLGCLIYELAALRPPFDATNAISLAVKVNQGHFSRIPRKYSDSLFSVIRAMIHVDPRKRPSVEELEKMNSLQPAMNTALSIVNDFRQQQAFSSKIREVKTKEENLKKIEQSLNEKQSKLQQWENDLTKKYENLVKKEQELLNREEKLLNFSNEIQVNEMKTEIGLAPEHFSDDPEIFVSLENMDRRRISLGRCTEPMTIDDEMSSPLEMDNTQPLSNPNPKTQLSFQIHQDFEPPKQTRTFSGDQFYPPPAPPRRRRSLDQIKTGSEWEKENLVPKSEGFNSFQFEKPINAPSIVAARYVERKHERNSIGSNVNEGLNRQDSDKSHAVGSPWKKPRVLRREPFGSENVAPGFVAAVGNERRPLKLFQENQIKRETTVFKKGWDFPNKIVGKAGEENDPNAGLFNYPAAVHVDLQTLLRARK